MQEDDSCCPEKTIPAVARRRILIFMILDRTDLRIDVSGTKFDAESDFEVHSAVAPQKPGQNYEKLKFRSENFAELFFGRRKMKRRGSSETRFGQV